MAPVNQPPALRKQEFLSGVRDTLPLLLGALPFGLIYGAVAATSGLSLAAAIAMSALVFAGSSQFIAIGLVAAQTPVAIIVLTTLIVNLRHMLYSATLLPYLKDLPQRWRIPLAFWLTDETFAVDRAPLSKKRFLILQTLVPVGLVDRHVSQLAVVVLSRPGPRQPDSRCAELGTRCRDAGHLHRHDHPLRQNACRSRSVC
jgi:hypothetical protein